MQMTPSIRKNPFLLGDTPDVVNKDIGTQVSSGSSIF